VPPAADPWWVAVPEGLRLRLHVQPGARRSAVVGVHGERLKIALQAPPVEGRANAALLRLLGGVLDLRADALQIAAGASGRDKTVLVRCAPQQAAALIARLRPD
jgi:uncharacterized protein (TIGR00251 family)